MNGTVINEIDARAISHLKNEINQNKILIEELEDTSKLVCVNWDKMNENCAKIMDYKEKIKELEKKALTITFKYF